MSLLEVLFTPADFEILPQRDLSKTCCVVFDVLRATSTMTAALWHGAEAILPVEEISDAIAASKGFDQALLAGERQGLRISAELTGGKPFDLGNSPREFTPGAVRGKTIVMTTTNGTRALRACRGAERILPASFLNLIATADAIRGNRAHSLLLVCSGTLEEAAYEDALGAGALCEALWSTFQESEISDSARIAREIFRNSRTDLLSAMKQSRNARRLLSHPDLRDDVAFCLQLDAFPLVAEMNRDGLVRRVG